MTVTRLEMRALTTAAAPTTMNAEAATGTQQGSVLKGKGTHRSWALLPEELVRYIATWYLWARASSAYVPATWEAKQLWHPRILYSSLRDAFHLERTLMCVCPQWGLALESHLFWQQAITLVDPTDSLAHLAIITPPPQQPSSPRPYRLSPYRHFRQIVSCSCLVCRINNPATSRGLLTAKRTVNSYLFGLISLCREHEHRRLAFCGFCLRESQVFELVNNLYAGVNEVGVLENEDDETFPAVEATCRSCRSEWLWSKASAISLDQAAIGGPELCSDDWETRQSVDGFIELAEGTVTDVINLARDKYWLRKETRLGDMMQQALAAAKFNSSAAATASLRRGGGAGYGTPIEWAEIEEEEEEESSGEEDTELMQLEEGGVKDLALGDWARTRILDGYWISPADLWYHNSVPGKPLDMPAVHPCPWTIDSSTNNDPSLQHPQSHTISAPIPPSFNLCEQAFISHGQQLRLILLPAMKNIVRRIAIECALEDSENENEDRVVVDPTLRASRMSLEEVMRVLREEEGLWFEGYDWVERRRNDVERERSERRRLRAQSGDADEDDNVECSPTSTRDGGVGVGGGDSSSSSVGSTTTSPVLSTTTLQTTPSPPPLSDNDGGDNNVNNTKTKGFSLPTAEEVISNKVLIPVEPVLNPPRVLRSIPYVPITVEHLPQFSLEAFKNIWREACSPLYHCRCRICERAVAAANANASPIATQQQYRQPLPPPPSVALSVMDSPIVLQQPYHRQSKRDEVVDSPVQIQLQEVSASEFEFSTVAEDREEAIAEFENYDEEEVEEEEEMYDSEDLDSGSSSVSVSASGGGVERKRADGAKRRQLEEEGEEEEEEQGGEAEEEERMKISPHAAPITVSDRTRKRPSDEIEDKEDRGMARDGSPPKRQRKIGVNIDVENVSNTASTTRTVLDDGLVSTSGPGHHVERERVQKKRSSEELDDDYGDDHDDYTRIGGHGGGVDGEERMSRIWKKKRQRIGDLNTSVSEEEGSRSEGRNSRSRSPTTPTATTSPTTTTGNDVDGVDGSRSRSVTVSEGD